MSSRTFGPAFNISKKAFLLYLSPSLSRSGFTLISCGNFSLIRLGLDLSLGLIDRFSSVVIAPFIAESYRLGSKYVSKVAGYKNREYVSSVTDADNLIMLISKYREQFWNTIDSLTQIQRTQNRKAYQIIAGEKERIASELSSTIAWDSFNRGVISKGNELKEELKLVNREGLVGREIRSADLTKIEKQIIITDRRQQQQQ